MSRQHGETTTMKMLYIFLTRSGTLLSNLVYSLTGAQYTHISLAFDEDLSTLYSSTRKNGYTMFPAGPSREYLNRGVFLMRENIPCALYALEVTDEAYTRAKRRTQHMMYHGELYRFNSLGLAGLPQRQSMELGEVESVMGLYLNILLGAVKGRVRRLF